METKKRINKLKMNILGTNIISSLGFTADENFDAVKQGISGVKHYDAGTFDLPEAFMASLINKEKLNDEFVIISSANNYTNLEKAAILSIISANKEAKIDLSDKRTLFVLSTTKGNVDSLDDKNEKRKFLWHTAGLIVDFFGNKNTPIIVSNACISGSAAQIAAMRALQSGKYDNAVVTGVDFLSKFIISGFQSLKALSPEPCKPFDKERAGLNLGEASATIIFSKEDIGVRLMAGAVRNDSNHISAPSRTGEGAFRALRNILQNIDIDEISFVNAHGTATPYNDAMETAAITRAGLTNVPVNSLKACFGHTLGAAGVLESIISMRALEETIVLKSMNFTEQEFKNPIHISMENQTSDKKYFVKMLSGLGGVNAALLFFRG
jgi:3-oxoacyl-[acyl-carrier-protein] synthase-1